MSDSKPVIQTTPPGTAIWPRLDTPDTKFKAEGKYSVKLRIPEALGRPIVDAIEAMATAEFQRAKAEEKNPQKRAKIKLADLPVQAELDDEGAETGNLLFNFGMTASGVSKKTGQPWTRRPALFDAKGKPLPKGAKIGSGSTLKVAYTMSPFTTGAVGSGVSLRLEAVQVLELRQFGEQSASGYGFGEEEGYTASEDDEDSFADSKASDTANEGEPADGADF